jgi:predicted PurR-regulated permease PerM
MTPKTARAAFLIFFALIVLAFLYMAAPLMKGAFLAMIVAILFYPMYRKLLHLFRGRSYTTAFVMTAFCSLIILLPLTLLAVLVIGQLVDFISTFIDQIQSGSLAPILDTIGRTLNSLLAKFPGGEGVVVDLRSAALETAKAAGTFLYQYSPKLVTSTLLTLLNTAVMTIFLVVFFAEGAALFEWLVACLPISRGYQDEIMRDIRLTIVSYLAGTAGTALIQALLLTLAFSVVGFANPWMWGLVAMIAAFLPIMGAASSYLVATIVLAAEGRWQASGLFLLYGFTIVSSVDNFIRPLVMGTQMRVHPVLLFVALIGGVRAFGPIGVIFGPVLLAIFLAALRIYQREFAAEPNLAPQ